VGWAAFVPSRAWRLRNPSLFRPRARSRRLPRSCECRSGDAATAPPPLPLHQPRTASNHNRHHHEPPSAIGSGARAISSFHRPRALLPLARRASLLLLLPPFAWGCGGAPPPPRLWRRRVRAPLLCRRAQATLARTAPDRPALSLGLFFSLVISACDSPSKPSATPLSTPPPHTASHRTATFPASMVLRPNQPNALHPRSRLHSRLQPASVRIHSTLSRGDTTRPRAPRSPSSPICSLFQNAPRYALCSGPSLAFVISHRCTVPHQSVRSLRSVVSAVSGLCGQWSLLRTCPQC
jgi:hypothetical protein